MSSPSGNPLKDLIHEIHRRSVWQVLAIYLVGGWIAFEVVQTLTEGLDLPAWFPAFTLVLLIIGLPIVLATAFVQEGGPGATESSAPLIHDTGREIGERERGSRSGSTTGRLFTWRNAIRAGVLAFALWGMVAAGWAVLGRGATESERPIRRIAVLPLDNFTGDPEQEYFVDGMTEQLITELAQIQHLLVMSRSAVMRYKENPKPVREIARELDVDAVVEGSVLRVEDEVRITAQLIDGRTEAYLWGRDYVRSFRELLSLQKDVARAIAEEIEVSLTPEDEVRLTETRTVDPKAHEAYLKGIYLQRRFQDGGEPRETLERSIEFFREALAVDPTWAAAHAELARAYHWLASSSNSPKYYPRSKAEAREAIRLDPSLSAAHGALAFVLHNYDLDWPGAEREYLRAFELAPNDNYYRWGYALFLVSAGRYDEAVSNFRKALERAPQSAILASQLGWALACAGRYDEAAGVLEELLAREPRYGSIAWQLGGVVEMRKGRTEAAVRRFRQAADLTGRATSALSNLAYAYASSGREAEARDLLAELEERGTRWMPAVYARLGETERALDQLEQDYEERRGNVLSMRCDQRQGGVDLTRLESLRHQPRFQELLRRIDFPE